MMALAKPPVAHARTKHIDIKYHYISEGIQNGLIAYLYNYYLLCLINEMIADLFAKGLPKGRFELLQSAMGMEL